MSAAYPAAGVVNVSAPTLEFDLQVEPFRDEATERLFVQLRMSRLNRRSAQPSAFVELPDPDVTVVVPAKNEEGSIAGILREVRRYAGHVLVLDGHSTDRTTTIARSQGVPVVEDNGRGKGAALRSAIDHVHTPIVVFIDADGSHDPIDIPLLVAPLKAGEADHVTGSRLIGGSSELHGGFDEFLRLAGSSFITYCINRRWKTRLSDSQNGFRAIKVDVIRRLPLREDGTTIEMEMIMQTLRAGFRMAEVPTHERSRICGVSKISLKRPRTWFAYGRCLVRNLL
jgi:dolichol-phosphate mannosyltransferase